MAAGVEGRASALLLPLGAKCAARGATAASVSSSSSSSHRRARSLQSVELNWVFGKQRLAGDPAEINRDPAETNEKKKENQRFESDPVRKPKFQVPSSKNMSSRGTLKKGTSRRQRVRRRQARQVLAFSPSIKIELAAATPIPEADVIGMPTAARKRVRSALRSIRLPSEKRITAYKLELAESHGTATATFRDGAYISNPILFFHSLISSGKYAIGGDAGGGHTKLGVTYEHKGVQSFACLLVYEGNDHAAASRQRENIGG